LTRGAALASNRALITRGVRQLGENTRASRASYEGRKVTAGALVKALQCNHTVAQVSEFQIDRGYAGQVKRGDDTEAHAIAAYLSFAEQPC
jgi:hypothetical protein